MSNLVKADQYKIAGYDFTKQQYAIIRAHESDTIKRAKEEDSKSNIELAIIKANINLGHQPKSDNEVSIIADGVYSFISSKYPTMRIAEIVLCIELGSFGEYGEDVIYLSATNIVKWCKTYLNRKHLVFTTLSTAREKERLKTAENESKQKELEYWQRFPQIVATEFEYYQDKKELSQASWRICKGLDTIGFTKHLDIDKATKLIMMDEEEVKLRAEKREELQKSHHVVSDSLLKHENLKDEIINRCKQRCLKLYFSSVSEINLKDFES